MLHQHCTNFLDIAQEKSRANIEQKDKIVRNSHKKRKDSLETRAVLIEILMLCWNLPNGPKHRGSL